MEEADYKSLFSPMHTPVLINLQGATAKPLSPKWLICLAENFPKITIMTRNSRLNSLSGTKNKRLLFKVVKTK